MSILERPGPDALLVQVTGGPAACSGRDLAAAHARLGITSRDFDRVAGHLVGTPPAFEAAQEDVGAVGAALTAHRDGIVPAPAAV